MIVDTISAIPPYSAIPSRGQLELRYPLPPSPLGCDRASFRGYSAIPAILKKHRSEGEKPPKIRKKSSQEQSSWELFGPPPTEKTEKIGKIKGILVRKVPGNLRSQEFVFFLVRFFCPLIGAIGMAIPYSAIGGSRGWTAKPMEKKCKGTRRVGYIAQSGPASNVSETTRKMKFAFFRGGGGWAGGQRGKFSKTLFFVGNATTIKF